MNESSFPRNSVFMRVRYSLKRDEASVRDEGHQKMRIAGVASALPKNYYPQEVIREALKRSWIGTLDKPQLLDRMHANVGVNGRHLAFPIDQYEQLDTWGKTNDAWIECAQELGKLALCRALNQAGIAPQDLGAIFFISVTGIASPSIEGRLINLMGLSPRIKRVPIFGLGCVAGAAGIARAADYVRAFPKQAAAVVSVELCSLTWQRGDLSVPNLISTGLFGDGAAAAIVGGEEKVEHGPTVLATRSVFYPDTEDVMGWNISEKGFRIVLSRSVPDMVRMHLAEDVDQFLSDNQVSRADIGTWIMHTGGPKVLEATEQALNLTNGALDASWQSLAKVGNLSSASVLLVLEEFMTRRRPEPGSLSILAAMGPGFCSELVLLRW
jgi:alkylresorcinol/alkylpyrone synthase